jgi:hypothetical protein
MRQVLQLTVLLLCVSASADAQHHQCTAAEANSLDNRGEVIHTVSGTGQAGNFVSVTANTTARLGDPCRLATKSEAWLLIGAGTPCSDFQPVSSGCTKTEHGSNLHGVITGQTKHWYVYDQTGVGQTFWNPPWQHVTSINIGGGANACYISDEYCLAYYGQQYILDGTTCSCVKYTSPIIFSGSNHHYELTNSADGVSFDLDSNGVAEQVSWTRGDSDDAFLVWDRNGNGLIDDGAELFGNFTPLHDGTRADNGFDVLIDLDGGGDASDGVIDARDTIFGQLRLWTDRNHNGISDVGELTALPDTGVHAIRLWYKNSGRTDGNGNRYRYVGEAVITNPGGEATLRPVYDVFLVSLP